MIELEHLDDVLIDSFHFAVNNIITDWVQKNF